jgi:hypothetical protein
MCWFRVFLFHSVFFGVLIAEEIDGIGDKGLGNKTHQNVTDCAIQVV